MMKKFIIETFDAIKCSVMRAIYGRFAQLRYTDHNGYRRKHIFKISDRDEAEPSLESKKLKAIISNDKKALVSWGLHSCDELVELENAMKKAEFLYYGAETAENLYITYIEGNVLPKKLLDFYDMCDGFSSGIKTYDETFGSADWKVLTADLKKYVQVFGQNEIKLTGKEISNKETENRKQALKNICEQKIKEITNDSLATMFDVLKNSDFIGYWETLYRATEVSYKRYADSDKTHKTMKFLELCSDYDDLISGIDFLNLYELVEKNAVNVNSNKDYWNNICVDFSNEMMKKIHCFLKKWNHRFSE